MPIQVQSRLECNASLTSEKLLKENGMASNEAASTIGLSDKTELPATPNDLSPLLSAMPSESVASTVFEILDQHAIALDTQSYPANLYAESLLYMIYWFHRLRDPIRKNSIAICVGKYLNVDHQSQVVNALLSDQNLKIQAKQRIDQGVMVRKTVDVLVMREGQNGREFLTLNRAFFP